MAHGTHQPAGLLGGDEGGAGAAKRIQHDVTRSAGIADGSGTTLIAAEKTGRIGWLIELDPKYVDVIVRRWQDWRGQDAYRERDGLPFNMLACEDQKISSDVE